MSNEFLKVCTCSQIFYLHTDTGLAFPVVYGGYGKHGIDFFSFIESGHHRDCTGSFVSE